MARSKKKKWKSRIKKALKLAAIGGATYLAAKRFGGKKATVADTAASEDANIGVTHPALAADAPVIKTDTAPAVVADSAPISGNTFRTRHRITDSAGNTIPSTNKMANIAAMNAPKGIYPPGMKPMPRGAGNLRGMNRAKGGRIGAKKGGRVTGIAKRGFGRALMKGKK